MATKLGKWAYLKGKYPKLAVDATYAQKLDMVMDTPAPLDILGPEEADMQLPIRHLSDFQLQKLYVQTRDRIDDLTAQLSSFNLIEEALTRCFVDRWEESGMVRQDFEGGISIGHSIEPYPTVKDRDALAGWLKKKGLESLLTLNYMTMASLVKERLEGKVDEPLPDGVEVFLKDKLTCRGRKKAGQPADEKF